MTFSSALKGGIISLHVLVLLLFFFGGPAASKPSPKKIRIHTLQPKASVQKKVKAAAPISTKGKAVSQVKAAPAKKVVAAAPKKKVAEQKAAATAAKPKPKEKLAPLHAPLQPLVAELEERIAKIDQKPDKLSESKRLGPTAISSVLEVDKLSSLMEEDSPKYSASEELIGFLYETLHLPDFGRVKVRMTVLPTGIVKSVTILESESTLNKAYLETHLPGLHLPLKEERNEEKSFIVNFCNEF